MGCGGSVQSAPLQKEDLDPARSTESTVASKDTPPGDCTWKEVVKVDSQRSVRSGVTTAICTPALNQALEGVDVEQCETAESLSAGSFDPDTGAPDMDGSKLNANLRKFATMLDAEGTVPQDFPRLARLIIRKQARLLAGQGLKVCRCLSEDSEEDCFESINSTGTRRLTDPVLADERFNIEGPDHRTGQQLQAQFWRSWQEKDPSLAGRLPYKEDVIESSQSTPAILSSARQVPEDLVAALDAQLDTLRIEEDPELMRSNTVGSESEGRALEEALQRAMQEVLYKSGDGCVPDAWAGIPDADDADWQRRENVLFILDWDDTIFPTTWLTMKPWFRTWIREKGSPESITEIDPEDLEKLHALDAAACELLACANRMSTVVCITLSQRPWVEMSMKAFMPRLAELWKDIGVAVHYAVEEYVATPARQGFWCQKPSGAGGLEGTVLELHLRSNRKRKVMERVLRRFYRKNDNCWLHAVSVGDGLAERDALQEISMCHQNPPHPESGEHSRFLVKTIQMMEEPNCEHLEMQLEVLRKWAQVLISRNQDLDAVFGF